VSSNRRTPIDQHLTELGRTSEVEVAASSLDALLERANVANTNRAPVPLLAIASEHVRERRIAENDPDTGLKGPRGLRRFLRDALQRSVAGQRYLTGKVPLPLLMRVELIGPDAGDARVVHELALVLQDNIASRDFLARTATRELTVVLCGVAPRHAASIRKRQAALCQQAIDANRWTATASVSVRSLRAGTPPAP